jgi:hypothetical protein
MNKFCLLSFFCIVLLASCNSPTAKVDSINLAKDTILKQFVAQADSFTYFDTIDANYRLLRAYLYNDTGFLSNHLKELKYTIWTIPKDLQFDSCATTPPLNTLGSDEAYRFIFEEAFNYYKTNITISRSSAGAKMHFLIYRPKASEGPCQIINEYDKQLTSAQWDTIVKSLRYADFWGLRGENGQMGIDGSNLYIDGFRRGQDGNRDKMHRIYRWSPNESSIWDAYKSVYRFSGFTQFTLE